ncbi:MAG: hypothetical protein IPK15_22725 [Verrucomicrobia bacterium]|nr:hypothetical protein [Verrucomicrobiota bacterium]
MEVYPGPWTATNVFQIVSDNGTNRYYDDGIEAKFLEVREFKFRVDPIALGSAVPSPPTLRFVAASGNDVTLNWFSTAGSTYRVQMKPGLTSDWVDMSSDITACESSTAHTVVTACGRAVLLPHHPGPVKRGHNGAPSIARLD